MWIFPRIPFLHLYALKAFIWAANHICTFCVNFCEIARLTGCSNNNVIFGSKESLLTESKITNKFPFDGLFTSANCFPQFGLVEEKEVDKLQFRHLPITVRCKEKNVESDWKLFNILYFSATWTLCYIFKELCATSLLKIRLLLAEIILCCTALSTLLIFCISEDNDRVSSSRDFLAQWRNHFRHYITLSRESSVF